MTPLSDHPRRLARMVFAALLLAAVPGVAQEWKKVSVPAVWKRPPGEISREGKGFVWYRCRVQLPASWRGRAMKLYVESAANAVDTGKLSVAHAVADSSDEFVELDESGDSKPAKKKAAPRKKTTSKVSVKKKAPAKKAAADEGADAEPAAAPAEVVAEAPAATEEAAGKE